jgi:hypothetical protein
MPNRMDRQFKALYKGYLETRPDAGWIADAIDQAIADLHLRRRIRLDARHFLLLNFDQMVVLPLEQSQTEVEDLPGIVSQDLHTILAQAAEDYQVISSHAVLDAAAEVYESAGVAELWTPY